jgi:hypothetical protein
MSYMEHLLPLLKEHGVEYLGLDVVPSVVQENAAKHGRAGVSFQQLDITKEPLPATGEGDLIICRHLMFHLPPADNANIVDKLSASEASLLMLTTYIKADDNERDFVFAMGHKVNLFRQPYCVRDAEQLFRDDDEDLYIGLWALDGASIRRSDDACMQ